MEWDNKFAQLILAHQLNRNIALGIGMDSQTHDLLYTIDRQQEALKVRQDEDKMVYSLLQMKLMSLRSKLDILKATSEVELNVDELKLELLELLADAQMIEEWTNGWRVQEA